MIPRPIFRAMVKSYVSAERLKLRSFTLSPPVAPSAALSPLGLSFASIVFSSWKRHRAPLESAEVADARAAERGEDTHRETSLGGE